MCLDNPLARYVKGDRLAPRARFLSCKGQRGHVQRSVSESISLSTCRFQAHGGATNLENGKSSPADSIRARQKNVPGLAPLPPVAPRRAPSYLAHAREATGFPSVRRTRARARPGDMPNRAAARRDSRSARGLGGIPATCGGGGEASPSTNRLDLRSYAVTARHSESVASPDSNPWRNRTLDAPKMISGSAPFSGKSSVRGPVCLKVRPADGANSTLPGT